VEVGLSGKCCPGVQDVNGRLYEDDHDATFLGINKYGAELGAQINPQETVYIAIGFDVPSTEMKFTIVPGDLVASWSGNLSFELP